jgi:hypothetical protein
MNYAQYIKHLLFGIVGIVSVSACNKMPDHARFIPKDATVVVGINTQQLSKKVAWSALTGSKRLKELRDKMPEAGAILALGEAGIKGMSTSYLYMRPEAAAEGWEIMTALIPLDKAGKWEDYVKKTFPQSQVTIVNGRKITTLKEGVVAGWDDDLLVVKSLIKKAQKKVDTVATDTSLIAQAPIADSTQTGQVAVADSSPIMPPPMPEPDSKEVLLADLGKTFTSATEGTIIKDERFKKLESKGYDVTVWMNNEVMMSGMGSKLTGNSQGVSLSPRMWAGTAVTMGLEFEKGKLEGDILAYSPEDMKEPSQKLLGASVDNELVGQLPTRNADVIMALNMSPAGIKTILEKMGVLGLANMFLFTEGLSIEDMLAAFTGDIGMTVSESGIMYERYKTPTSDTLGLTPQGQSQKGNSLYCLKIGNRQQFDKMIAYAATKQMLVPLGVNRYRLGGDSTFFTVTDKYLVVTSRMATADTFISGGYRGQEVPIEIKQKTGNNPVALFVDLKRILNAAQSAPNVTASGKQHMAEAANSVDDLNIWGGKYKNGAFSFDLVLNCRDKEENSLFQLLELLPDMTEPKREVVARN